MIKCMYCEYEVPTKELGAEDEDSPEYLGKFFNIAIGYRLIASAWQFGQDRMCNTYGCPKCHKVFIREDV